MYAIPLFIMNCGFIGISSSVMVPYVLKISRKCASWTFLVSFSMTILALFGSAGGEGLREWLGERVYVRERLRACDVRLRERLRKCSILFVRSRLPLWWSAAVSMLVSSMALVGVRVRPREVLR